MPRQFDVTSGNLANYDTEWSRREYGTEVGLRPIEADLVAEFFPGPPARVLDLGCGAGRTTIGLADRGYDVLGIDLAEPLLALARRRYPHVAFDRMDATALALPDRSFDAALFSYNGIDVIYPQEARRTCLREVRRVLCDRGVFALSSHNFVGAIFSGGFLYAHGYLNALGTLASQITNPLAREWYIRYRDGGGRQHLYSAPPARTIADAEACGFEVLAVRGATGERRLRAITLHQQHVHFVLRKR